MGRTAWMADDEADLVLAAGAGDASAFRVLVDRYAVSVRRSALRLLHDEAEAEDIAQEAFLRLWRSAATLEIGPHGVGPWLRRVASNLAIDRLRSSKRLDVTDEVPEEIVEPEQATVLEGQDLAARLNEALLHLPERQRAALVLFHYEGMSQREVAGAMDVSEEALESLLSRARRGLRGMLKDDWRELLVAET
ncbi:MAG: sigma-70 family RNA polymerase sigma factor [Pseudomonadota bacterium]